MPKISIIIPVYNADKYLEACLESIINQTMKDIEILCIDNGSTDNSPIILKKFANLDSRIKVLKQNNLGAAVARNKGIKIASGEYLLFLDADDYFDLRLCDIAYSTIKSVDADVALFGAYKYDETTNTTTLMKWMVDQRYLPKNTPFSPEDIPECIFQVSTPAPWSKIFRRQFILDNNLWFQNLNNSNDVYFVYSALVLAKKITYTSEPLTYYRTGINNNIQSKKSKHPKDFYKAICKLKEELEGRGLFTIYEKSFINYAIPNCFWNFRTIKKDSLSFDEKLRIIKNLGGFDYPKDYYFNNDIKWLSDYFELLGHDIPKKIHVRRNYYVSEPPKVSIIIPVYNSAKYLVKSLESAINQTLKDIEIICINDESGDSSLQILMEYWAKDDRITIIDMPHGGLSSARNVALNIANGEYILFLDDDDRIELNAAEELFLTAKKSNIDIIIFNREYDYENEEIRQKFNRNSVNTDPTYCYTISTGPQIYDLNRRKGPCYDTVWTNFYKLDFLNKHYIRFIPGIKHEDMPFAFKAMLSAERATRVPNKYYKYFIRSDSLSTKPKNYLNFEGCFIGYLDMLRFWLSHDFEDSVNQSIARHLETSMVNNLYAIYNMLDESERKKIFAKNTNYYISHFYIQFKKQLEAGINKNIYDTNTLGYINCKDMQKLLSALNNTLFWLPRKVIGGIKCINDHGWSYTWHYGKERIRKKLTSIKVLSLYASDKIPYGLNRKKRSPRIIASLTSYPGRIDKVKNAIITLLKQTMKPDMIILWLAEDEFRNREKDLPTDLLQLKKKGLTIRWCEDLKSHKKYYYAMKEYPDDIIITFDDDLYYHPDTIKLLYESYKKFPNAVSALRTHLITFDATGNIMPYAEFKLEQSELIGVPSMRLFSTSGAGTLYPPHCMHEELFNKDAIFNTCKYADDIWLKIMQVMKGTPTVQAAPKKNLCYIEGTQAQALHRNNLKNGGNDVQLLKVLERYNKYFGKDDTLVDRIYKDIWKN